MRKRLSPFVVVEVGSHGHEWSYWLCAAALEPALPTWVGPVWGELMAGRAGQGPAILPVTLTREMYEFVIEGEHPSTAPHTVQYYLTQQAAEVLRRHNLQPIPEKRQWNDDIPF